MILMSRSTHSTIIATLRRSWNIGRVVRKQMLNTSTHTQPPESRLNNAMSLKRHRGVSDVDSSLLNDIEEGWI
jgi:hypothetical protein